jgi:hypothetical protein
MFTFTTIAIENEHRYRTAQLMQARRPLRFWGRKG